MIIHDFTNLPPVSQIRVGHRIAFGLDLDDPREQWDRSERSYHTFIRFAGTEEVHRIGVSDTLREATEGTWL